MPTSFGTLATRIVHKPRYPNSSKYTISSFFPLLTKTHWRTRVANADYVSIWQQYPWLTLLQTLNLNSSMKPAREECGWPPVMWYKLLVISATRCSWYMQCLGYKIKYLNASRRTSHLTGIPRNCVVTGGKGFDKRTAATIDTFERYYKVAW